MNAAQEQAQARDGDAGFSLMETIIAMVIFALVATATAGVLIKSATLTSDNRGRAIASKIAMEKMDALRAAAYSNLASGSQTVSRSGRNYTLQTLITPVFDDGRGGTRSCAAGGIGGQLYKRVGVTVSWNDSNNVKKIRNDTIVQNPGNSVDSTKGAIAVTVVDSGVGKAAPEPVAQQLVTLNTGESVLTDDSGCAFFDGLSPMTSRTITVAQPGWLDNRNQSPATATAGVTAGIITSSSISFDRATTLNLSFAPAGTVVGTYKMPTAGAAFVAVPQSGAGDTTQWVSTGITGTSSSGAWWPQTSGYAAWLGSCPQPAGAATAVDGTVPGANLTKTVNTAGVTVKFASSSTARSLVFANQALGVSCVGGTSERLTIAVPAGTTQVQVALPYGTWRTGLGTATTALPAALTPAAPTVEVTL